MKIISSVLALSSMAVPATAAPSVQSVKVMAGDLNLSTEDGQKVLARRIHRAARAMCAVNAMEELPQNMRAERMCIKTAKTSATAPTKVAHVTNDPISPRKTFTHASDHE